MPLTLRQVIDQIKAVADAHAQINGVGVGDFAELQSQTRVYPLFWIFHERSEVVQGYIVRRIRLLCADRVQTGQEGDDDDGMEIEVLSDTQRILMDFIAYFAQQHNQAYIVDRVGSIDPFTERFDDRVAGNTVLLTIKEAWDYSKCETPISTVTFPPTVDGLTLYDFGDASVLGRLTAQQVADLEAAYGTVCSNATAVLKNTANTTLSTTSIASGASQNITAPNATAVLKDTAGATLSTTAIPSNESADITAPDGVVSLNGTFYANVKSGGTLGVLATSVLPATITLGGTGLAAFAQQTLSCTESGYSSYVWHLVNTAYLNNVITLSGQNVNCYPTFDGTWTVYLMVTGAGSQVGYATTTFTVTNGLRPTVLINNTAPPSAGISAITQDAEWVRYQSSGANNVSHYQAARLTGGTTGGVVFRDTPTSAFLRVGLSPGITYAGAINQESDPAWDWIMGAWLSGNNLVYVQDNGGVVSTTKYIYEGFWWRMDRATSGTIRLYRGTDIHNINTLTHTYSLTNVSDLYIRLYNQSIRSHFQLMYYGAAA